MTNRPAARDGPGGDPRIIRLIRKWLKAGVLEDGVVMDSDKGRGRAR